MLDTWQPDEMNSFRSLGLFSSTVLLPSADSAAMKNMQSKEESKRVTKNGRGGEEPGEVQQPLARTKMRRGRMHHSSDAWVGGKFREKNDERKREGCFPISSEELRHSSRSASSHTFLLFHLLFFVCLSWREFLWKDLSRFLPVFFKLFPSSRLVSHKYLSLSFYCHHFLPHPHSSDPCVSD